MKSLWARVTGYFREMDARTVRTLWASVALFALAGFVLWVGKSYLDVNQSGVADFLRSARGAWWAPGAVTAVFVVLAFIGAPQIALIAGTIAVFGAGEGMILSWLATMISALVGFAIGRIVGAKGLEKLGNIGERAAGFMGRNGFLASLIIRQVPSGPFVVVNMALGAAKVPWTHFIGGTGIGILPKILLIAFAGHGFGAFERRENLSALAFFVVALLAWLLIAFVVRPRIKAREREKMGQNIPQ